MKVLVTEGSGLVGRWILSLLQETVYETVKLYLRGPKFSPSKCKSMPTFPTRTRLHPFSRVSGPNSSFILSKRPLYKSYSYAGNIAFQYLRLLTASKVQVHQKAFYLADYEPLSLRRYADLLAQCLHAPKVKSIPYPIAKVLALCGDSAKAIGIEDCPFTSFRLDNILTEYQFDMSPTKAISGDLPYTFDNGVKATAEWFLSESES